MRMRAMTGGGMVLMLFILLVMKAPGQFYNGSHLTFGKSRVQYSDFFWTYFRFDKFDTYFYLNGKELAQFTAEYADKNLREIEQELQSNLEEKIQFIIFNNLTDLKQSNIGVTGNWDSYNTGGVTRIIGGKVLLYFDGNYGHFTEQIRAGIAQVILNEMIYGTGVGAQIKNTALFNMPEWYINGLISYISKKWNTDIDNQVRDAVMKERYSKFNRLTGLEAARAGHSLWNYIALKYGEQAIPNIVYMARLSRNVEKGFLYVLGTPFEELINEWLNFYRTVYASEDNSRTMPGGTEISKRPKQGKMYRQFKLNPDGRKAAYCTHDLGVYKVWLYDLERKKAKRILRGGYRIAEKPDHSYPLLAWHPSGEILALIVERKGLVSLGFYSLKEKRFVKNYLYNFQKVLDFSYSDDGNLLVFSAVQKGQSDIFIYNIASGSYQQVTKDRFDDLNPRFLDRSSRIIFSSNRLSDTIRFDPSIGISQMFSPNDIFIYDLAGKKNILRRITATPLADETQPMPYDGRYFTYLSDQNGIRNRYLARFDSTIAFIDTATHYRYYTTSFPVTNYSRNILEQDISRIGGRAGEIVFHDQQYSIYTSELVRPKDEKPRQVMKSAYQEVKEQQTRMKEEKQQADSLNRAREEQEGKRVRFFTVTIGEVMEEQWKADTLNRMPAGRREDYIPSSASDTTLMNRIQKQFRQAKTDSLDRYAKAKQLNYNVEYSIDQLVTQIDFNYLNSAYQPYSGSSIPDFVNPGLNALFMVGITDLMEDYRLTGGVRLNFNLVNNEYLFSYSNMRRRIDHQVVYHRQTVEEATPYSLIRHRINELYYSLTYPFSPVLNARGTAEIRYDRAVYLATDQFNLREHDINNYWGILKGELTYDNTQNIGLNLYYGTRYKVFGEYYTLLNGFENNMFVLGLDVRHYQKIHRTMILALRFAASTSFGQNKLLYYMGGVDNWLNYGFNISTPVAIDQNYAFQTLATNMRGFNQNIRNGNSFFVINTELRVPVIRYLYGRPIRSDFLNNFQLVGFADAGTAWTGPTPYSEENQLFTQYIIRPPMLIKVQMLKEPIVEGFGLGLRSRILGYFVRGDLAWGVEDGRVKKPIFMFSLSLDF